MDIQTNQKDGQGRSFKGRWTYRQIRKTDKAAVSGQMDIQTNQKDGKGRSFRADGHTDKSDRRTWTQFQDRWTYRQIRQTDMDALLQGQMDIQTNQTDGQGRSFRTDGHTDKSDRRTWTHCYRGRWTYRQTRQTDMDARLQGQMDIQTNQIDGQGRSFRGRWTHRQTRRTD